MLSSNTAENAQLEYEAGHIFYAMEALTDSGDHTLFTSNAAIWSDQSGFSPTVRPDGLINGGLIIPDDALVNDTVDIAASNCYLAGVETAVIAASIACTRPAGGGGATHKKDSICITNLGAYAEVAGVDGGAFSTTRGAAGGPPLITVGYIEVGQVWFDSSVAAAVEDDEIHQVIGTHQERWDYPLWEVNYIPTEKDATDGGAINFLSALPLTHVGPVVKGVYAEYNDVVYSEARPVSDFVPPDESHSVSSQQVYGGTIGSTSMSLNQGSFTFYGQDGVTDPLVALKNEKLVFKFTPDRYKNPYLICQGKLGVTRSFPADGSITLSCTVSASVTSVEMSA